MFDTLTIAGIVAAAVLVIALAVLNIARKIDKELGKYDGQD